MKSLKFTYFLVNSFKSGVRILDSGDAVMSNLILFDFVRSQISVLIGSDTFRVPRVTKYVTSKKNPETPPLKTKIPMWKEKS